MADIQKEQSDLVDLIASTLTDLTKRVITRKDVEDARAGRQLVLFVNGGRAKTYDATLLTEMMVPLGIDKPTKDDLMRILKENGWRYSYVTEDSLGDGVILPPRIKPTDSYRAEREPSRPVLTQIEDDRTGPSLATQIGIIALMILLMILFGYYILPRAAHGIQSLSAWVRSRNPPKAVVITKPTTVAPAPVTVPGPAPVIVASVPTDGTTVEYGRLAGRVSLLESENTNRRASVAQLDKIQASLLESAKSAKERLDADEGVLAGHETRLRTLENATTGKTAAAGKPASRKTSTRKYQGGIPKPKINYHHFYGYRVDR